MSAREALAEPRIHDQVLPQITYLETKFNNSTSEFLSGLGHPITVVQPGMSAVHAVRRKKDGSWEAVGEPRQQNSGGTVV